jgi:hypothetical protein
VERGGGGGVLRQNNCSVQGVSAQLSHCTSDASHHIIRRLKFKTLNVLSHLRHFQVPECTLASEMISDVKDAVEDHMIHEMAA